MSLHIHSDELVRLSGVATEVELEQAQKKVQEWLDSNFAGFRRLLTPGSDCFPDLEEIHEVVNRHRVGSSARSIRNFVLMGTGGSSLGAEAIHRALIAPNDKIRFFFMDNNDPDWFGETLGVLDPTETLFFAVSKSGKTPETISQLLVVKQWLEKSVPDWKKHFVVCSDPLKSEFLDLAKQYGLSFLPFPSAVGGRFSVLSAHGLFPAIFGGVDGEKLLNGARKYAEALETLPLTHNPAVLLAYSLVKLLPSHPNHVLFSYSSKLSAFSRWYAQLWAESLGKEGYGPTPYPAIGTTDQHSQVQLYMEGPKNKVILFVEVESPKKDLPIIVPDELLRLASFAELQNKSMQQLFHCELNATRSAFQRQGIANATIAMDRLEESSLGALFYLWELTTAYAGSFLRVNPFDQPGVELGKILTKELLRTIK